MKLEKLYAVTQGLNRRFPNGNNPYQIMTRLLEESGELAPMVNHFEGSGVKREKYGEPDKSKMQKKSWIFYDAGCRLPSTTDLKVNWKRSLTSPMKK